MHRKLVVCFFCFSAASVTASAQISPEIISKLKLDSAPLNDRGQHLFGNGKPDFKATRDIAARKLDFESLRNAGTCYTVRSYRFDRNDTPQLISETTCTESRLLKKKYAGESAPDSQR
jgi:hypothetical protein